MGSRAKEKLYCYVDETGQDARASIFVVVAIIAAGEQEDIRRACMEAEHTAGTGHRKWHKSRAARRLRYIETVVERKICCGDVFFGTFEKPLPYFFPFIEVIEQAIKARVVGAYAARVYVDGIDRQKAQELTNALRARGISLELVKGRRDESEPLIRLADMWAGCIRGALAGSKKESALLNRAVDAGSVRSLNEVPKKAKTP